MKTKMVTEALEHMEAWPAEAQDRLTEVALQIEAALDNGEYHPTAAELAGIDRGLKAADEGRFAAEVEVEDAFSKFHRQ